DGRGSLRRLLRANARVGREVRVGQVEQDVVSDLEDATLRDVLPSGHTCPAALYRLQSGFRRKRFPLPATPGWLLRHACRAEGHFCAEGGVGEAGCNAAGLTGSPRSGSGCFDQPLRFPRRVGAFPGLQREAARLLCLSHPGRRALHAGAAEGSELGIEAPHLEPSLA
ncbi:unnamed protein product, partial [Symbiodinium necroappetens]